MMSNKNTQNPTETREARYTYLAVEETLENEELGKYTSFGISVLDGDTETQRISDVSTDGEAVKRLAALCTEQELSPEHIGGVIEDFLAEESLSLT